MIVVKNSKYLCSIRFCEGNFFCRLMMLFLQKETFLERGLPRILFKISQYLSSLLFCKRDLGFVV